MTNDGRKLDPATQAHIRRQVVLAVRNGMTQVEAAKVFGMSLRFVQKACAKARDGGLRSLKADDRGRPAGAGLLDSTQQARICRMITGKMPDQLRLLQHRVHRVPAATDQTQPDQSRSHC